MTSSLTRSTCPYCGVGCGITVHRTGTRNAMLAGDEAHPANRGRLCSKGSMLGETIGLEGRLLHPIVNGERVSWAQAINEVAARFSKTIRDHGPDSVAFYVSGQLLTEDYFVANKLMKGFIGSGNIDTNSRLCMSSAVAGHKRAFGEDVVPGCYEDFEEADLVVLVGSNTAWCHPILYQRLLAARARRGTRIIVIDPRRTPTCDEADLHLPIRPGADLRLFNALLCELADRGATNNDYVREHTIGMAQSLITARQDHASMSETAKACGISEAALETFITWFAQTPRAVTAFSMGINQSSSGVDQVNAIINCHLLTGRVGLPGMGPFSITGQPNAMGGREVGGLANQLAAHLDFTPSDCELLGRFWSVDRLACKPGLKAVDLFEAIHSDKIKALWVMATNPAVSLPDANRVRSALEKCEFVVLSDCMERTDTAQYADVLLPAAAWGEKEGTVTNSERRISRQRAFLDLPGEAKPDWQIICDIASAMGFQRGFAYGSPADIFREHAALSGFENGGRRVFDIGGLAHISDVEYDDIKPFQWPLAFDAASGTKRLFADGRFATPDQRACFVPVSEAQTDHVNTPDFPLMLNTGRTRDQWHTMSRTGLSATLSAHEVEPIADIHPEDGLAAKIDDGGLAILETPHGRGVFRARYCERQRKGSVFAPIHWSDVNAAQSVVGRLVHPVCDPISGQPAFKHSALRLKPARPFWKAFMLSSDMINVTKADYWSRSRIKGGYLHELAALDAAIPMPGLADYISCDLPAGEIVEMNDASQGVFRQARLEQGRLTHCLFATRAGTLPPRDWLVTLLDQNDLDEGKRRWLLAGRPAGEATGEGHLVCACMGVRSQKIIVAIEEGHLTNVREVGEATVRHKLRLLPIRYSQALG